MSSNTLGDGGATALVAALAGCRTLEVVDVTNNHIGKPGVEELLRQVEGAVGARLSLGGNDFSVDWFMAMSEEKRWWLTGPFSQTWSWGVGRRARQGTECLLVRDNLCH